MNMDAIKRWGWQVLAAALRVLGLVAFPVFLAYGAVRSPDFFKTFETKSAIMLAVYVFAANLYLIRTEFRKMYGLGEIILGLLGAYLSLPALSHVSATDIVAISACVYLMVRGIDNVEQGLTRPSFAADLWSAVTWQWLFMRDKKASPETRG